ncbi:MAG TPA: four helix bundle protein [Chitinophagaceae bacterium]|nr:four helix bundle protein [Chitinophagaceae bacterium]
MDSEEMKLRPKHFAVNVAKLTLQLPDNLVNRIYKGQIIRSSSSAAANYRASQRAKSKTDSINKRKIVEEEVDETLFVLEMLEVFNQNFANEIKELYAEGEILLKIIVASIVTSRQ